MPKFGYQPSVPRPIKSAGGASARPTPSHDAAKGAAAGDGERDEVFGPLSAEEEAFLSGLAKHRADFSATAVAARSESHRKKS